MLDTMMIPLYNVVQLHVVGVCVGVGVCLHSSYIPYSISNNPTYFPRSFLLSILFIRSPRHNTIKYVEDWNFRMDQIVYAIPSAGSPHQVCVCVETARIKIDESRLYTF